jgi:hypothetical protein
MRLAAGILAGHLLLPLSAGLDNQTVRASAQAPVCTCAPTQPATSAAFTLAGTGRLGADYQALPSMGKYASYVPPTLLKAIAWNESNWEQYDSDGLPLISFDFGYGVMQITSGMAGAFGNPVGQLPLKTQVRIGGDYRFNISYGAYMLAENLAATPAIDNRDPTKMEDWYYAIWAYNGWGWANNPNNPAYSHKGNPIQDPWNFTYQERILFLVAHPPLDAAGRPLWTPIVTTIPTKKEVGDNPGPMTLRKTHTDLPTTYAATYDVPSTLTEMKQDGSVSVEVTAYNAGGAEWTDSSPPTYALMYHWVQPASAGSAHYDANLGGIDIYDSGPIFIDQDVPVGGDIQLNATVQAPDQTGNLMLEWDMVNETSGWFSYNSVRPGEQNVTVVSKNQKIPKYEPPAPPIPLSGDHAWFVRLTSVSVPETLQPGQRFTETALFFNPGGTTWGTAYTVVRENSTKTFALPRAPLDPCRILPITIHGSAPSAKGTYTRVYRLANGSGHLFGQSLTVKFRVS